MLEFVREYFDLSGWRAVDNYDSNSSGWYEEYMELERTLKSLDNTLSAFGGAGFTSISGEVDRLWDALAALAFCKENLEYELYVEIDEKLMKRFGEMTDEFATLDVRNIRTPNILGLKSTSTTYDAEGNPVVTPGTPDYLTLENFTGAAGIVTAGGYKEQCITGFSDMLAGQYSYFVAEGLLDETVTLEEYLNQMMPHEFEYSQYTEVWKKTAHSFLDVLVVPSMIEAVTGVEFITGDHLTDNEQVGKAVQSLIQAVSMGMTAGGAYSKGLTYVMAGKLEGSQVTNYVTCKAMKSVAEDGVLNMITTELTEHDCGLAANVLLFAGLYVGMQEAPDFIDSYVESGALVRNGNVIVPDVATVKANAVVGDVLEVNGGSNNKSDIDVIENSNIMFRKAKNISYVEPMPKKQLQKIVKAFKKQGGVIQMDDATDAYLIAKNAEAITLNKNTILLRQNPGRASVFEELIHATQFRQGLNDGSLISRIQNEIKAQEMLLRNSKAYKLTPSEIKQTKLALASYIVQLKKMTGEN